MAPLFGYGDMRLYLLKLLDEAPRYGYELIRLLEDRFSGAYTPSAGAIYPRLAALEEEGLVEHVEEDGRKIYRLTARGREELGERGADIINLESQIARWANDLAKGVLGDMRGTLRSLQHDLRDGLRDVRRERRDTIRDTLRGDRERDRERRRHRYDRESDPEETRTVERSLRADLKAFITDLRDSAAGVPFDREQLRQIQAILLDARSSINQILDGAREAARTQAPTESEEASERESEA